MAIPLQVAALWASEHRQRPFGGRLLQLGRQSLFFDRAAFQQWCQRGQLPTPPGNHPPTDMDLFPLFGFHEIESTDLAADDRPTFLHDLNRPVPAEYHGRYDCVYDGGTIEHVFNPAEALTSVVKLLKPGGRAVHLAVTSNYVDHGFYQLSPTLFWDFYTANGFTIEQAYLIEILVSGSLEFLHPWRLYRYEVGCCDHFNSGAWGFSPWPVAVWVVARKTDGRNDITWPVQSLYSRGLVREPSSPPPPPNKWKQLLKRYVRPIYLPLVKVKRWLHTPRPPFAGTIDADGVARLIR